jgi:hypothetical protein
MLAVPATEPFPEVAPFALAEEEDVVVATEEDCATEDDDALGMAFVVAVDPSLETVPYVDELLLLLLCKVLLSLSISSLNSGFLGAGAFIAVVVVVAKGGKTAVDAS